MNQSRENLGRRPAAKGRGVEGDFVCHFLWIVEAREPLAGEVAIGSLVPLHRDEARRKLASEELPIEIVIGGIEARVCAAGRGCDHGSWSRQVTGRFVSYDTIITA